MTDVCYKTCVIADLPTHSPEERREGSVDPSPEITALARHTVSPSFFHQEDRDRFASLTACGPGRAALFKNHLQDVSERIASLPTEAIAAKLKSLYEAAYLYEPKNKTMDVADTQAKRELDLWLAAIDHKAYEDESVLAKVRISEIERVLALSAPHLSPAGRGLVYQLENHLITADQFSQANMRDLLFGLRTYDGRSVLPEAPFFKSHREVWNARVASVGREKALQESRAFFSDEEALRKTLSAEGLWPLYEDVSGLTEETLVARTIDLSELMSRRPEPRTMLRLARELTVISMVTNGLGRDFEKALDEASRRQLKNSGLTPEDADLVVGNWRIQRTYSRLDDYGARFAYLARFREIYADFLRAPIEKKFSPDRSLQLGLWSKFLLNHGATGIPLSLADLDRIRSEVQAEIPQGTDRVVSYQDLKDRDPETPLWLRPDDLGTPQVCSPEPLSRISLFMAGRESLSDYVARNVDFIAILPGSLMPSPLTEGIAIPLFGVILLHGDYVGRDFTRLAVVLAHETAHHEWARSHFDDHSERLAWQGPNERWAYLRGREALQQCASTASLTSSELFSLEERDVFDAGAIRAANRRLGLGPNDFSLLDDHASWNGKDPSFFDFQPGAMVNYDGTEAPDPSVVVAAMPRKLNSE
ncbi:MAG TPA: hypothetical protein VLJ37_02155 [bacterium]|nr:hypothetical protein [bacterium]